MQPIITFLAECALRPFQHGNPVTTIAWAGVCICAFALFMNWAIWMDVKQLHVMTHEQFRAWWIASDRYHTIGSATFYTGIIYLIAVYGLDTEQPATRIMAIAAVLLMHIVVSVVYGMSRSTNPHVNIASFIAIVADLNIFAMLIGNAKPYGDLRSLGGAIVSGGLMLFFEATIACALIGYAVYGVVLLGRVLTPYGRELVATIRQLVA